MKFRACPGGDCYPGLAAEQVSCILNAFRDIFGFFKKYPMPTPEHFNELGEENLPGHLGITFTHVKLDEIRADLKVRKVLLAPNGFLHVGTIISKQVVRHGHGIRSAGVTEPVLSG